MVLVAPGPSFWLRPSFTYRPPLFAEIGEGLLFCYPRRAVLLLSEKGCSFVMVEWPWV